MKPFNLPIRFGLATSAALILYFLALALFNLHTNIFFSVFNIVITGFEIYEAIKYRRRNEGSNFDYKKGFSTGIVTGFMATLLFTVFFTLYTTEIDLNYLPQLSEEWFRNINFKGIVYFTVAIMGFATSLVLTLSFMQLFKKSNNTVGQKA